MNDSDKFWIIMSFIAIVLIFLFYIYPAIVEYQRDRRIIKQIDLDAEFWENMPSPPRGIKTDDTLSVCWNDEDQDIECFYPAGVQTMSDANYMLSNILDTAKCKELENRGYNLSTLKFEIAPKKGDKRFQSERK